MKAVVSMGQILNDLTSQSILVQQEAARHIVGLNFTKGSPYSLPIVRALLELVEPRLFPATPATPLLRMHALDALSFACSGLEPAGIIECMERVLPWPNDWEGQQYSGRYGVLADLIEAAEPTDAMTEYMLSRVGRIAPLEDQQKLPTNLTLIATLCSSFHDHFNDRQIDDLLTALLVPQVLDAPAGADGIVDYDFEEETPAVECFLAVHHLVPHLSEANWKSIGDCFFQLNYTPVELVRLLYESNCPQGVDVLALVLDCYTVASEFRVTSGASLEALEVLLRRLTIIDNRLLSQIASLVQGNLEADLPMSGDYYRVREASAALVPEILRLQVTRIWNAPLTRALFGIFSAESGSWGAVQEFGALLKISHWPDELLRGSTGEILDAIFGSWYHEYAKAFWNRLCQEYPAPQLELLDAFSEQVETNMDEKPRARQFLEALDVMVASKAYEAHHADPESLFCQQVGRLVQMFLSSEHRTIRSMSRHFVNRHFSTDVFEFGAPHDQVYESSFCQQAF